jgi:hypothetical protein
MDLLQSPLVLALVCALTFYGAGAHEARSGGDNHGLLWAALSALTSTLVLMAFDDSWAALLIAQLALFVGIGVFRAMRET